MEPHSLNKVIYDTAAAGAGFSAPWWLQIVQNGGQMILTVAGIVLLGIRIWVAVHDLRRAWKRKHIAARVNAIIAKQDED